MRAKNICSSAKVRPKRRRQHHKDLVKKSKPILLSNILLKSLLPKLVRKAALGYYRRFKTLSQAQWLTGREFKFLNYFAHRRRRRRLQRRIKLLQSATDRFMVGLDAQSARLSGLAKISGATNSGLGVWQPTERVRAVWQTYINNQSALYTDRPLKLLAKAVASPNQLELALSRVTQRLNAQSVLTDVVQGRRPKYVTRRIGVCTNWAGTAARQLGFKVALIYVKTAYTALLGAATHIELRTLIERMRSISVLFASANCNGHMNASSEFVVLKPRLVGWRRYLKLLRTGSRRVGLAKRRIVAEYNALFSEVCGPLSSAAALSQWSLLVALCQGPRAAGDVKVNRAFIKMDSARAVLCVAPEQDGAAAMVKTTHSSESSQARPKQGRLLAVKESLNIVGKPQYDYYEDEITNLFLMDLQSQTGSVVRKQQILQKYFNLVQVGKRVKPIQAARRGMRRFFIPRSRRAVLSFCGPDLIGPMYTKRKRDAYAAKRPKARFYARIRYYYNLLQLGAAWSFVRPIRAAVDRSFTVEKFMKYYELNLSMVVFRSGLLPTRRVVNLFLENQQVCVNGKILTAAKYQLNNFDVITFNHAVRLKLKLSFMKNIQAALYAVDLKASQVVVKFLELNYRLFGFAYIAQFFKVQHIPMPDLRLRPRYRRRLVYWGRHEFNKKRISRLVW